jgi:hypothetical protein
MFTLTNNKKSKFQFVFTVVITVIAILTLSMTKLAPAGVDKSYDALERVRASRSFTFAPNLASYDQIENARAQRALSLSVDSYSVVEQLRITRGLIADRSYDLIEALRLEP